MKKVLLLLFFIFLLSRPAGSVFASFSSNLVPDMTSDSSPSGQTIGTPWNNEPAYQIWKMFDRDTGTMGYQACCSVNYKMGYIFPEAETITRMKVSWFVDQYGTYNPTVAFIIQGSNDGTNWDTIYDSVSAPDSTVPITFDITSPDSYTHYQIYAPSNYGIAEWEMYETLPDPTPTPTPFTQPESTSSADWCTYKLVTEDYTEASWIFGFPIPDTYDSSDESSYFLLDFNTGIGWDTVRVQQNVQTPTDLYPESNGWSVTETDAYTYKIDYNLGTYPIIGTPEDYLKKDYDLTQSIGEHSWFGMGIFGTNHAQPTDVLITVEYIDGKTLACSNESVVEEECDTLDIVCHINKWIINIKKWFEGLMTRFYGWLYALFVPTQSTTDAIEDLTDIARTKSPWAYLYAVQDMDLTNPSYATSTSIPDFNMGALSVKIRDGATIQLTPEVTLQSSTWGNLTELVEKVRDGIGVFIIIAWALGLAVLIVNNIL